MTKRQSIYSRVGRDGAFRRCVAHLLIGTAVLVTHFGSLSDQAIADPSGSQPASVQEAVQAAARMAADGQFARAAHAIDWTRTRVDSNDDPAFTLTEAQREAIDRVYDKFQTMADEQRRAAEARAAQRHANEALAQQVQSGVAPPSTEAADTRLKLEDLPAPVRIRVTLLMKRHERLRDPATGRLDAEAAARLLADIKPITAEINNYPRLWLIQAQLALVLERGIDARIAARHLARLRAEQSLHPLYQSVIAGLNQGGYWPAPTE